MTLLLLLCGIGFGGDPYAKIQRIDRKIDRATERQDWDRALDLAEDWVVLARAELPENDPILADGQAFVAQMASESGDLERARDAYLDAAEIRSVALGVDPLTADTWEAAALFAFETGQAEAALDAQQMALEIWVSLADGNEEATLRVADASWFFASMLRELGGSEVALPYAEQTRDLRIRHLGADHERTAMAWSLLGHLHKDLGHRDGALAAYEHARGIHSTLDPDGAGTAQALRNIATVHLETGDYALALAPLREALRILEGGDPFEGALARNTLGQALFYLQDYPAAEAAYRESIAALEGQLPADDRFLTTARSNLAALYVSMGRPLDAVRLYEDILAVQTRTWDEGSLQVANARLSLARPLRTLGQTERARELVDLAVTTLEEAGAKLDLAYALRDRGSWAIAEGRLDEAEVDLAQADQLAEEFYAALHPFRIDVAATKIELAAQRGELDGAREATDALLAAAIEEWGSEHPAIASIQLDVAHRAYDAGQLDLAGRLVEQISVPADDPTHWDARLLAGRIALDTARYREAAEALGTTYDHLLATVGDDSPQLIPVLEQLAALDAALGDFDSSRRRREAVVERLEVDMPGSVTLAQALNNLSIPLIHLGEFAAARQVLERSIALFEGSSPDHALRFLAHENLGTVLRELGDTARARLQYEGALVRAVELHGPQHPEVARLNNNLGSLHLDLGKLEDAARYLEAAVDTWTTTLGPNHPDVATALDNLAGVRIKQERWTEAQVLIQRALDIRLQTLGAGHPAYGQTLNQAAAVIAASGDLDGAALLMEEKISIQEKRLSPDHPALALSWRNLGEIRRQQGRASAAEKALWTGLEIQERASRLGLGSGSERERIALLKSHRAVLDAVVAVDDGPRSYDAVLRWKGAVSRGLVEERAALFELARRQPELEDQLLRLLDLRGQISSLILSGRAGDEAVSLGDLTREREALERRLSEASGAFRSLQQDDALEADQVCGRLPEDSALVDYLVRDDPADGPQLTAWVMRPNRQRCELSRIELGAADAVTETIRRYRRILTAAGATTAAIDQLGAQVREQLWDPVAAATDGRARILVVPDGPVSAVSFGGLPTEAGYLLEDRQFLYQETALDVLRWETVRGDGAGALVVGGVDYGEEPSDTRATRGCAFTRYAALPATEVEAEQVSAALSATGDVVRLSGTEATEERLNAEVAGRRYVHLATHGFFATGRCRSALGSGEGGLGQAGASELVGFNPMTLSGLVVAEANTPGQGLWTADEVASLDLRDAELVVLSACETGLGEVVSGEGVLGLRRAVAVAGARSMVMSLWAVPDEETQQLMATFYAGLIEDGQTPAEALRGAQLKLLETQREAGDPRPVSWAAFIASGAP